MYVFYAHLIMRDQLIGPWPGEKFADKVRDDHPNLFMPSLEHVRNHSVEFHDRFRRAIPKGFAKLSVDRGALIITHDEGDILLK